MSFSPKAKRLIKGLRRSLFEAIGSRRYSMPALHGIDAKLARYLPKENGIFVEAGANDGYTQSNTYYFERWHNWSGLLVEGIPHLHAQAKRLRKRSTVINAALVEPSLEGTQVEMSYGDLMSIVKGAFGSPAADIEHLEKAAALMGNRAEWGTYKVDGFTLSTLLDRYQIGPINLLSLDVEGYEISALRGLDLKRHRPSWICIEARNIDDVINLLHPVYALEEKLTHHDYLLRCKHI